MLFVYLRSPKRQRTYFIESHESGFNFEIVRIPNWRWDKYAGLSAVCREQMLLTTGSQVRYDVKFASSPLGTRKANAINGGLDGSHSSKKMQKLVCIRGYA